MSSYYGKAIHPLTGNVEEAVFLDDYYGRHRYGVRFPDGSVFPAEKVNEVATPAPEAPTNEG